MKVMLVTGGSGFIGSNFINYFLRRNKGYIIINYDNLVPSQNSINIREIESSPRYHFVKGSILNQDLVNYVIKRHRPDYIINFACETNSKRNITNPIPFFETNVMGTLTLLESARYFWSKHNYEGNRFIQVSTTGVYGFSNDRNTYFSEDSHLLPQDPYTVSKASSDMLVKSFVTNFNFPAVISRCCSNYGPNQCLEEIIPSCIKSAIDNQTPCLGNENDKHREWLYVLDHCTAIVRILFYGKIGEIYNIGSGMEYSVREIANKILKILGKPEINIEDDKSQTSELHCTVNSYKIRNNLSWGHKFNIDDGLGETVRWYMNSKNILI